MTEEIIKEEFDKAFKKHFPNAIIIDGVNVEGCSHRDGLYCNLGVICNGSNCNYKQLKRLEQENEELTKLKDEDSLRVTQLAMENTRLEKQNAILLGQLVINDGEDVTVQISQSQFDEYNELKQENKTLKNQIESQKGLITVGGKQQYELTLAYDKYFSALKKIKEIADKFDYWNNNLSDASNVIHEIIEKIDEVIDE